jgi:U3 small nucleolar RNA-associated protein 14
MCTVSTFNKQVPYPFTSKEQYERAMRQPVGKEWNTTQSVRELTRKDVLFKAGTIIDPIHLSKQYKQQAAAGGGGGGASSSKQQSGSKKKSGSGAKAKLPKRKAL